MDLLEDVADGNIVAVLEVGALALAAAVGTSAAWSVVQREEAEFFSPPPPPPTDARGNVAVNVDLGPKGEPKGISRLFFKPLLPRSEMLVVNLTMPLGLLIEERDDGAIIVTGALPGYGAIGQVEEADLVRAVTAFAAVAGDAPMWQQVTSGTPVGDVSRKRLIFKTEGATYANVRDAIASHRGDDGDDKVTLVLERASNTSAPETRARLEPLSEVLGRDLKTAPGQDIGKAPSGQPPPSAGERVRRLLDFRGGGTLARRTAIYGTVSAGMHMAAAATMDSAVLARGSSWSVPAGLAALAVGLEAAQPLLEAGSFGELSELLRTPVFGAFLGLELPPLVSRVSSATPTDAVLRAYPSVSRAQAATALTQLMRRLSELDALCEHAVKAGDAPAAGTVEAREALDAARYHLTEAIARFYGPSRTDGTIECLACAGDWGTGNMR